MDMDTAGCPPIWVEVMALTSRGGQSQRKSPGKIIASKRQQQKVQKFEAKPGLLDKYSVFSLPVTFCPSVLFSSRSLYSSLPPLHMCTNTPHFLQIILSQKRLSQSLLFPHT